MTEISSQNQTEDFVRHAVEKDPEGPTISPWDLDDAVRLSIRAFDWFSEHGDEDLHIVSLESKTSLPLLFQLPSKTSYDITFVTDMEVTRGKEPIVIDWKTAEKDLDATWYQRQVNSWQWRIYAAAVGASLFIYRGVSRSTGRMREVRLTVPDDNEHLVMNYLYGVVLMYDSLVKAELKLYPRHMPQACFAFGRTCPWFSDCASNNMPRIELPLSNSISYSMLEKFLLCPERYRRSALEEAKQHDPDAGHTNFGRAFHRGIKVLYERKRGEQL